MSEKQDPRWEAVSVEGFEIYAAPVEGEADAAWERQLAEDVSGVLHAPEVTLSGAMYQVRTPHAAAIIMLLPAGGEWVWPVFESHPIAIDLYYRGDCPEWKSSEELARYVYRQLDKLSTYELLLVHDLESYVDGNFRFPERRRMASSPRE
ncbi:hypothetical protein AB0D49_41510 [Streptomyces sp. NPDC048290]|uniref:hypothetical protein n=1 Tax=Streptomyces sp. NPDC048290 TaxID=3155811 RepID=UPI00341539FD